jgi:hypothetical protein
MSHVDEGQLHAYLDGGLSAMDAVRVERHLADCAPCREQLDKARGLVSRAAKLLEWASPPERAMPPLSDLRPAAPQWRTPVGWAATIVIALGLGVYGGSRLLNRAPSPQKSSVAEDRQALARANEPVTASPIVVAGESTTRSREAEAPATRPAERQAKPPALLDSTPDPRSALANRTELDSLAKRRVADSLARNLAAAVSGDVAANVAPGRRDSTTPTPPAPAPAPAPAAVAREQRAVAQAPAPAATRSGSDTGAARFESVVVSGAAEQNRARGLASPTTSWTVITRDSASRLLRGPIVALPDLPINAVRASNDAVVVEQVVPPGQVIRLVQRRGTATDQAARSGFNYRDQAAKTSNEALARYVGGLRVEITGPLPSDSLSKLLDRVRVIP